jgi:prenyltransferase beta subunit
MKSILWAVAMTIRLEMIRAVSRSKAAMEDSISSVVDFLTASISPDGGFKGRDKQSDLYYTVFGLEALLALGSSFPRNQISNFVQGFTKKEPSDLVHLAATIRCYVNLSDGVLEKGLRKKFIKNLERFRSKDGGFANNMGAEHGTAYGCFFALTAYQDLQTDLPNSTAVAQCIGALAISEGGFTNNTKIKTASTNATAAAMIVLNQLNLSSGKRTADWLLAQCTSDGGFLAMPMAPVPDLLSTATALHALAVTGFEIDTIKEECLDFVDSLWCGKGGFYGNWTDAIVDCEYTYYGLLALGHLGK